MKKELSIIGFGNQAKAWALNLRDSGYKVFIGLRPNSSSREVAESLGFQVFDFERDFLPCSRVAILAPDDTHEAIMLALQEQKFRAIFAHGYSLYYENLADKFPQSECLLLAPKAIASELRLGYETKQDLGALYSVEYAENQEAALSELKLLAADLGITSFHPTSAEAETKADLFSEQALLCSTLPYASLMAYNKLREKGVNQETAYFECWKEVSLIAQTMVKMGPIKFFDLISPNALAGSELGRRQLFDDSYDAKLEELYRRIDDGSFADQVRSQDFGKLREDVLSFWSKQELSRVHDRLTPTRT